MMAGFWPDLFYSAPLGFCTRSGRNCKKGVVEKDYTDLLILCSPTDFLEKVYSRLNAETNPLLVRICVLQLVVWRAAACEQRIYPVSYFVYGAALTVSYEGCLVTTLIQSQWRRQISKSVVGKSCQWTSESILST